MGGVSLAGRRTSPPDEDRRNDNGIISIERACVGPGNVYDSVHCGQYPILGKRCKRDCEELKAKEIEPRRSMKASPNKKLKMNESPFPFLCQDLPSLPLRGNVTTSRLQASSR